MPDNAARTTQPRNLGAFVLSKSSFASGPQDRESDDENRQRSLRERTCSDPDGRTTSSTSRIAIDPTTQVRAASEGSFPSPPQSTATRLFAA